MAILPLYNEGIPDKQTDDSDSGRLNDFPVMVRDSNGRFIAFYEKKFRSGRLSDSEVSFVSPSLDCHVEAGNGMINSVPVIWTSTNLTLVPNTYTLIYVDQLGTVGHTADFPISFVQNIIVLAFVNVGGTSIVRLLGFEKDGYYIFHRKQVLLGSIYVWDDYEYRLNVGTKPTASYDTVSNIVYLAFQKDGASFIRAFDLTNPLTWEDLGNVIEISSVLYPVPQPLNELIMKASCDKGVQDITLPLLYELARNMAVGLDKDTLVPYVHLPYVTSSYLSAMIPPPLLEVYTKSGSIYTLEVSISIDSVEKYNGLNLLWSYTRGEKYLGLRISHNLYIGDFVTGSADYLTMRIPDYLDFTELIDPTNKRTDIFGEIFPMKSAHSVGNWNKDAEFAQTFEFPDDTINIKPAYSVGDWNKDAEFTQTFEFSDDTIDIKPAYSVGEHTITNV